MAGQSARNVGLVYIDARGVGRRALLKRAGKAVVKARMGGRDVVLGPQAQAMQGDAAGPSKPPGFSPTVGAQSTSSLPEYTPGSMGSAPIVGGFKK
jgi:spartin